MRAPPPARRGAHRDEHHCSARGSECDVTDDDDWKSGNITKGMISSAILAFWRLREPTESLRQRACDHGGGAGSAAGGPRSMQGASVYGVYMHLSACMQVVFNVCAFAHANVLEGVT